MLADEMRVRQICAEREELTSKRDDLQRKLYRSFSGHETDLTKRKELASEVGALDLKLSKLNQEYNSIVYPHLNNK